MLRKGDGVSSLFFFYESVGLRDSNEAELLGIRKALTLPGRFVHERLIAEGDSLNAI